MLGRRVAVVGMVVMGVMLLVSLGAVSAQNTLTPNEDLGKSIFFDDTLSLNLNQSCASCHGVEVGFTGPHSDTNAGGAVYEGSVSGLFGERKPPSAAYATQSPIFHLGKHDTWMGG